ncbi:Arc family DNA-binding protein [Pseudomonas lurida]|uniref:Arc family DNA-binding protein n=1 Tax=Pseudomonas TaxID=286 RepID=UPI0015E2E1E8|nr:MULTISPECIES: Arc family DNA-binding protein [Pseudomonas]MBA1296131.1 Arc family DNA-binding protein [Pseudomonas lurida]
MSINQYDSRTADKFVVRLPDGLRADIEAAANAADRSMNSVFVQAVLQYLDGQNRQALLLKALASAVAPLPPAVSSDL